MVEDRNGSAAAKSAKIDELLQKERKLIGLAVKILVLGIQRSGKTTFMRQFKSFHESYSDDERCKFKTLIHASVVGAVRQVDLSHCIFTILTGDFTGRFFPRLPMNLVLHLTLQSASDSYHVMMHLLRNLHAPLTLWTDDTLRAASQLDTSAIHFLNSLNRISALDYTPSDNDILRCKAHPLPPIDELSVTVGIRTYSLVCARQNLATKHKWLPYFDIMPSVIFVLNLEDYDLPKRMREAVDLFGYVCNYLHRKVVNLLLNKPTSLRTKLVTSPLASIYPDYTGGDDELAAVRYISQPFTALIPNPRHLAIYTHIVDLANADENRPVMCTI
ncbi:guanine nucleotide binding protein, alpha subunit [Mycena epipterygia]|nr:guanine nucleotide binding protein, alpha subunit [Mycena epipterygia]